MIIRALDLIKAVHTDFQSFIHSSSLSHFGNLLLWQNAGTTLGSGNARRNYRVCPLKSCTSGSMLIVFPWTSILSFVCYLQFTKSCQFSSYLSIYLIPFIFPPDILMDTNPIVHLYMHGLLQIIFHFRFQISVSISQA